MADAHGNFSENISVPAGSSSTPETLTALGVSSQRTATASLTITGSTLVASPSGLTAGGQVTLSGAGFAPGEVVTVTDTTGGGASGTADNQGNISITVTTPASYTGRSITYTALGSTSKSSATATVTLTTLAPTATATATSTPIPTGSPAASPTVSTTPAASTTPTVPSVNTGSSAWYFAAGRTDAGYSEQIDILNPNSSPVQGTITAYYGAGKSSARQFTLAALSRGTYDAGAIAGQQSSVAIVVQAGQPIAAAATGIDGSNDKTALNGVSAGATQWYFAEGYTGLTFKETLSVFNPGTSAANVQITWPVQGSQAVHFTTTVPAHAVVSVPVNQYVKGASHATIVTSNQKVVAARTLAFGASGQGTTVVHGATGAGTTLYLAEGSTANGFQEFVSLLNPRSTGTAHVKVTFYGASGTALASRTLTIAALGRGSIDANSVTHASSVAAVVRSDVPVVAERSMYMGSPNAASGGGTDVFATAQAAAGWAFAAGDTGAGQKEFITLLNPGSTATSVLATWYEANGQTARQSFSLTAHARLTVDVVLSALALPAGTHGVVIQSTGGVPFVAEEALYNGTLRQGAALSGDPVR